MEIKDPDHYYYTPKVQQPIVIPKKWGYEKVLINMTLFCSKILHYNESGSVSSFHFHPNKSEYFLCINGRFNFRYKNKDGNTQQVLMQKDDGIYIPKCIPHQLVSLEVNSEILEVSTFHDDNDVVRIEPGDSQR